MRERERIHYHSDVRHVGKYRRINTLKETPGHADAHHEDSTQGSLHHNNNTLRVACTGVLRLPDLMLSGETLAIKRWRLPTLLKQYDAELLAWGPPNIIFWELRGEGGNIT